MDTRMRPYKKKPCTWNGITYASQQEAATTNYVSKEGMHYRLKMGYACDADMREKGSPQPCTWNGIRYVSITNAARANHVSKTTMWYRLRKGYTCDKDLKR